MVFDGERSGSLRGSWIYMVFTRHTEHDFIIYFFQKNKSTHGCTWLHFWFCSNTCKTVFSVLHVYNTSVLVLHMATHGPWLHMATHGHTWLHMATHPHLRSPVAWRVISSLWEDGGINVWHIIPICFSNKPFHTYFNLIILQAFIFDQISDVI